jgi:beta-galactosidase
MKHLAFCILISFVGVAFCEETYLLEDWSFTKDGRTEIVRIPHDWAISGPFNRTNDSQFVQVWNDGETQPHTREGRTGGLPVVGTGIYEKTIKIPENTGWASLVFDGIMDQSRIFVDNKLIAERKNGYAIFEAPFSPEPGERKIRVEVTVEPMASRWYQGAGLYRPVKLVLGEAIGIKTHGIYARTTSYVNGIARISVRTDLRVPPEELAKIKETETILRDENTLPEIGGRLFVRHTLLDASGKKVSGVEKAPVSMAKTDTCFDVVKPHLWCPESPYLYTLVTEVVRNGRVYDTKREKIGIRTISFAADGFRLNGVVRKFKGVNLHHDLGPLGAAFNKSAFRRQVRLLKEMGVDSIRTAHNFPPPWQTQICDELGIMLMAESLDEWLRPKQTNGYWRHFAQWWERDFTDSYKAVINSPSIVMWSIGNEVHDQRRESGYKAAEAMINLCHKLDPSRPVTAGLSWVNNSIESGLLSLFDVPAYTYHLHRYEDIVKNTPHPFIVGAESSNTISSRGVYHFPVPREPMTYFSEKSGYPKSDHQVTSYDMVGGSSWIDKAFALADDNDWVLGGFIWTGIDYLGEPTPYQTWPSHSSYYGPIDLAGLRKDRFYLHRANWRNDSPTLHILPHWTWPGREGKITPVFVYTSWPEAELFVNGVSQGRRRKDPSSLADRYRLRWFDVAYEKGEIRVVAFDQSGNAVEDAAIKTAEKPARIIAEADRTMLSALSSQDTPELGYVTIKVVDKNGTLCPHESSLVRVKASGSVKFKCIANGDSTCLEPFTEPQMHLFNGMLVATVEATDKVGAGALEVSIDGLENVKTEFTVFNNKTEN